MKNILYVMVATALITVTPFLISFNPERVPYRGFMVYSILAILLLFTNVRERLPKRNHQVAVYGITYALVAGISLYDTWYIINLLKLNGLLFSIIPFVTTAVALLMLKQTKAVSLKLINTTLFSILFLHLVSSNVLEQPLLTFTLIRLF